MKNHLVQALSELGESLVVFWELEDELIYISRAEDEAEPFRVGFFDGNIGLHHFRNTFSDYPAAFEYFNLTVGKDRVN